MNDTFMGWQSYPLQFHCVHCGETCDIDFAYEHDHCEPIETEEEEKL
jgi:hypothetical protein